MTIVAAAVIVIAALQLAWIVRLIRDNEELRRKLQEWKDSIPF